MKKYLKYILFVMSIIIPMLIEKFIYPNEAFSSLRFIFLFIILLFLSILIVFDGKKQVEKIYKWRYAIVGGLFVILVALGIHGSSISIYNNVVQPNTDINITVFGTSRSIRSDEWGVSTPTLLSQTENNFNKKSNLLMAEENYVTLFPKLTTKSLSIITSPSQIGFLFLPNEQAFSFYWLFGYFAIFLATFELLMLITKQNKLYSLLGSIIVTFSPLVQWWESWNVIAYGEIAMILFDKYLKQNKIWKQILLSILIGIVGSCYIMCLYPAWQIPYGFVFLILSIWIIKNNKENFNWKKLIFLILIVLAVICALIIPIFVESYDIFTMISNTVYPGARLSTGGTGWESLFNYFSSIFNFYSESSNPSEMSQMISLYPVPIMMGIFYCYNNKKNKKKDFLLFGFTLLSILLSVWNYIAIPTWLSKITLLSMSLPARTGNVVSYICVLLLIMILSNYSNIESSKETKIYKFFIAMIITFFGIYVVYQLYPTYITQKKIIIDIILFMPIIFFTLLNTSITSKIAIIALSLLTLLTGIFVHPLNIGLSVLYEKPIANEVRNIKKENKDAVWATVNTSVVVSNYVSNYLLANGIKIINSTNYYPNFNLWKSLNLEKYDEIFNRYAHLHIDITDNSTIPILNNTDVVQLNLNKDDVCKLNINYMLSTDIELDKYNDEIVNFKNIYSEDGMLIYKVNCSE